MAASPSRRATRSLLKLYSPSDRIRIHAYELLEVADEMDIPSPSIDASDTRADIVERIAADLRGIVRGPC